MELAQSLSPTKPVEELYTARIGSLPGVKFLSYYTAYSTGFCSESAQRQRGVSKF